MNSLVFRCEMTMCETANESQDVKFSNADMLRGLFAMIFEARRSFLDACPTVERHRTAGRARDTLRPMSGDPEESPLVLLGESPGIRKRSRFRTA